MSHYPYAGRVKARLAVVVLLSLLTLPVSTGHLLLAATLELAATNVVLKANQDSGVQASNADANFDGQ
jgi:hypothetical protein